MTALWIGTAALPLLVALGLAMAGLLPDHLAEKSRLLLTSLAPVTVLPAAWLGSTAPDGVEVAMDWLLVGTTFRIDDVGRPLLVLAAVLYGLALVMVARSDLPRPSALSGLLLLCFVANAGVFVAADVVTLYLCFTVMSLVGYALVIHDRTADARRSGRIYLFLAVLGEAAVLVAAMLVVRAGGLELAVTAERVAASGHTGLIVALLWLGFGIKVGVVPLHVWLPLAHPAAPTPASAVLSGAMITGGLAGWLRMLPLGEVAMPTWGLVFVVGGLAGAYLAVLLGVMQAKTKAVLAYSSISQMGMLSALVGAALIDPDGAPVLVAAAVLYALHHGIIKAALFFGVGLWGAHGAGSGRVVVIAGFAVAGLSLAGLPWTSGYLAKYSAKEAADGVLVAGLDVASALVLVGMGSTVLLARAVWLLGHSRAGSRGVDIMLLGWVGLIGASIPLVLWTAAGGGEVSVPGWWDLGTWWAQGWPVLAGVGAAALALRLSGTRALPDWLAHPDGRAVPPGDLVVAEEWLASMIRQGVQALSRSIARGRDVIAVGTRRVPAPARWFNLGEQHLATWRASGLTFLGMAGVFVILAWWGA
ncbi:complex I subunit 5 family protein [Pseudactinotalea sp. Z1732]|uniref:complex I subunit 5 family protein n=1 Tax=Micrococcales TaxID=85006 RepID=UPI003C7D9A6E